MATQRSIEQRRQAVLETVFGQGAFMTPDQEYDLRASDFQAEIPQTGERWESREALRTMQRGFGRPPGVRLQQIRGRDDLWVVETIQDYDGDGEYHACVIIEFEGDKIARETRYYAPHSTPPERGAADHT